MTKINVGEFFILGFRGTEIPQWLKKFAQEFGLGGVILFDYNCQTKTYENNIRSPEQVRELCRDITHLPSSPLVFVDQEGGKVRRLKEKLGFEPLPSHFAFNLLTHEQKQVFAEKSFSELRRLGIHFNLAPVIDLNINPKNPDIGAVERSFSADPQEVLNNVAIMNQAAKKVNLGLCLKHFPGLGGATVNSHEDLTDLSETISQDQLDLFYKLGKTISGKSVLVSHGMVHPWERDVPISMSKVGIGKLRKMLPDALLISDDLQMQGLQKKYPSEFACIQGLKAGLDVLCIGNNMMAEDESILEYAEAVLKSLETDPAFRAHAQSASQRVARTKSEFQT